MRTRASIWTRNASPRSSSFVRREPATQIVAKESVTRWTPRVLGAGVLCGTSIAALAFSQEEPFPRDLSPFMRTVHAAETVPFYGVPGTNKERTFIAVKPDGVQRSIVGEVIKRFEARGYKLVALKLVWPTKEFAEKHYADLSKKPFFPGLVKFFSSGPVVAMVWEGVGSIKGGRSLVGATNPADALPGSIRGDLCINVGRNIIHGSDGPESAKDEISLWFKPEEVINWNSDVAAWVNEK